MDYQERVICFIDILGFKGHIDKSIQNKEYTTTILMALDIIDDVTNTEIENSKHRDIDVKATQFSDSIVISYTIESDDQLAFIIMSISDMILRLIPYGFLLRGAITQGELIHTDRQLFGPAMNQVYKLESEDALYPRIIVTKQVFERANFSLEMESNAKKRIVDICEKDEDGWRYIDYIGSERYSAPITYIQYIESLSNIIKINTENAEKKVLKKYKWLTTKLSHELKWIQNTYRNLGEVEIKMLANLTKQIAKFETKNI